MVRKLVVCSGIVLLLLLQGCYKTEISAIGYRYGLPVPEIHIVQRGDTLFGIGKRYNISYRTLIRFNHIAAPYTIYVGQRIYLTHTAPKSARHFIPRQPVSKHSVAQPPRLPHRSAAHARKKHNQHPKKRVVRAKKRTRHHLVAKKQKVSHRSAHQTAVATVMLRWPATGPVTSKFGSRGSRMHDGIDIGGKLGSAVVAAAAGTVVYADHRLAGYGNLIILRHHNNLFTAYAHNQVNLVRRGDKVRAGEKIAKVGKTGRSTGPHLHFEVRRGTTPVDPLLYLPRR